MLIDHKKTGGLKNKLHFIALYVGTFSVLFSGDYLVFGFFPAFYIAWFLLMASRVIGKVPVTKSEINFQSLAFLLVLPLMFYDFFESKTSYFNTYLYLVLGVNTFAPLSFIIKERRMYGFSFVILLFLGAMAAVNISLGHIRGALLFGPNVIYRIGAYLFGVLLAMKYSEAGRIDLNAVIMPFLSFTVIMVSTGSRGASVVWFAYVILIGSLLVRSGVGAFRLLAVGAFGLAVTVTLYERFAWVLWRLTYFSAENASISARVDNFAAVSTYISNEPVFYQLLGFSSKAASGCYFNGYPHNVVVEALVYGGWFFALLVSVSYLLLFRLLFFRFSSLSLVAFPLLGVYLGALFSGDMWENFIVPSFGLYLFYCSPNWGGGRSTCHFLA